MMAFNLSSYDVFKFIDVFFMPVRSMVAAIRVTLLQEIMLQRGHDVTLDFRQGFAFLTCGSGDNDEPVKDSYGGRRSSHGDNDDTSFVSGGIDYSVLMSYGASLDGISGRTHMTPDEMVSASNRMMGLNDNLPFWVKMLGNFGMPSDNGDGTKTWTVKI